MAIEPVINISRALNEQGGSYDLNLVSAFTQNSIELELIPNGKNVDDVYIECTIDSIPFRAVRTVLGVGSAPSFFVLDLTNILPSYLGLPPTLTSGLLTKVISIAINAYGDAISIYDVHPDIYLCFGYPKLGEVGGMDDVVVRGVSRTVYHCGQVGFYNRNDYAELEFTINGINYTYPVSVGYNLITLNSTQLLNGNLTALGGDITIPVIYKANTGAGIAWINSDGAWSIWNFRYIKKVNETSRFNPIPAYATTNGLMEAKSIDISTTKKVQYYFDTIAVDATHYEYLTEIAESPRVIYANKICRVKRCSNDISACKQNLHFELILEIEENAVNY